MRLLYIIVFLGICSLYAADWPVYMGDASHRGITEEQLPAHLSATPLWVHTAPSKPSPGFYMRPSDVMLGMQKIRAQASTYDYAYAPIIANGRVYYGSSSDESLTCLDAATGAVLWTYGVEGAVRFAPSVWENAVYFGSDDGRVYCLDAEVGTLKWSYNAAPEQRWISANGRIGSQWPVRTAVHVDNSICYFSAGLFPANGGVHLCAVKAETGAEIWRRQIELPAQGYLLVENNILFVPNGRASPVEYALVDGSPLVEKTDRRRQGGSSFIAHFDDMLVYGPTEYGMLRFRVFPEFVGTRNYQVSLERSIHGAMTGLQGWRIIGGGEQAWFLREDELVALDGKNFRSILKTSATQYMARMKKRIIPSKSGVQLGTDKSAEGLLSEAIAWKTQIEDGRCLIRAGSLIITGGKERIIACDALSGTVQFDAAVDGLVWELAVADGCLYAATDTGALYCFGLGSSIPAVMPVVKELDEEGKTRAKNICAQADCSRGFAALIGDNGVLAAAMAATSDFSIISIAQNRKHANDIRKYLRQHGITGADVSIRIDEAGQLPFARGLANLVVLAGAANYDRVKYITQPHGGTVVDLCGDFADATPVAGHTFRVWQKGTDAEAGRWTHMFANSANTACSGDKRVAGTKYRVQWFGNPSPWQLVGWHALGMGPLAADGRMYVNKVDHVDVVDSYNGTLLWSKKIPGFQRFSPSRVGGNACVDEKRLFCAVKDSCFVFDAATGDEKGHYFTSDGLQWGAVFIVEDTLIGTTHPATADSTAGFAKDPKIVSKKMWSAADPSFIISQNLFAMDASTGLLRWTFSEQQGGVLASSICIGDGMLFAIVGKQGHAEGLAFLDEFLPSADIIALDMQTGDERWRTPLDFAATSSCYLSYAHGNLVLSGSTHVGPLAAYSRQITVAASALSKQLNMDKKTLKKYVKETNIKFILSERSSTDGQVIWSSSYVSDGFIGNQHSYNISHPVITANRIWHVPAEQYLAYAERSTGTITEDNCIQRGKGCMTPTGSEKSLFFRSTIIGAYDMESQSQFAISSVNRPSCWMSVLPVDGLVLMPEYSLGCNCAFPMQTSVVMAPQE